MLRFTKTSDFLLVDTFQLRIDGTVGWLYQPENAPVQGGFIRPGMHETIHVSTGEQDEDGNEIIETQQFDVWAKYCELRDNGTITVQPVPQTELDAIAAEQAKQTQDALKRTGAEINGHTISLTEANQNGLAAVMQGAKLADEAGASIFPLNFKARTESGETSIPFTDMTEFKAFCLAFLQARQQFF